MRTNLKKIADRQTAGFTVVELVIAVGVGTIVALAILTVFTWSMRTAMACRRQAMSQTEAILSSQKVIAHIRNASAISKIDKKGKWVELSMPPSNTVCRLSYIKPKPKKGEEGRIELVRDKSDHSSPTLVVATGVTKVMTLPARNVFEQTGPTSLRLAYRVARPMAGRSYPVEIDIGVRLRND